MDSNRPNKLSEARLAIARDKAGIQKTKIDAKILAVFLNAKSSDVTSLINKIDGTSETNLNAPPPSTTATTSSSTPAAKSVADLEKEINQLKLQLNDCNAKKNKLSGELTAANNENATLKKDKADLTAKIDKLKTKITELENELKAKNKELEKAKKDCETEKEKLKKSLADAKASSQETIDELNAENAKLESTNSQQGADIAQLTTKIEALKKQKKELETKIAAGSSSTSGDANTVQELENKINELNKQIQNATTVRVTLLNSEISDELKKILDWRYKSFEDGGQKKY